MISINNNCKNCGLCVDICPTTALRLAENNVVVNDNVCIDCGICAQKCPYNAISEEDPRQRLITDVRLQITHACNFFCPHCFSNANRPLPDELTAQEAVKLIDQLIKNGLKTMTLTGGEPLLRKKYSLGVLTQLKNKGIYSKLFTNGSLLDAETIKALSSSTDEIQISYQDFEENNKIWPSLSKQINTVLLALKNEGLRVFMRFTITSSNYNQIPDLINLAEENKIDGLRFRPFIAKGRGALNRPYLLSKPAFRKSLSYLANLRRTKPYPIQLLTPSFAFAFDKAIEAQNELNQGFKGFASCKCIDQLCAILPNGDVQACAYFPQRLGNIRETSFESIWLRNSEKDKLKVKKLVDTCMTCRYISICGGGCRANAWLNSQTFNEADPFCPLKHYEKKPIKNIMKSERHL